MKKSSLYYLFSIVVVLSMALAACQPTGTATSTTAPVGAQPPAATSTTAATQPTATTAAAAFKGDKVAATDCSYGGELKSIEAIDANTVKFSLCYSDPAFIDKAAFNVFSIAPKAFIDKMGGDSIKMSDTTDGTGPFMVKSWTRGDNVTFVVNPNYWGKKPAFSTLIFKWSDQSAQRLLELQSGQADGIDNPAAEDMATIQKDSNLKLYPRQPLNVFYIGFNVDIAPFNDVKVRQAFAQAIDRKRIVDQFYPTGSLVADNFVPKFVDPGYSPAIKWYDYNPDAAKKLLADANWKSDQEITLYFRKVDRTYLPSPDKVAQEVQAQLKAVGVNVKIEQQESATFIDNATSGKLGFYLLGWGADYPDATDWYDYHFTGGSLKQFGTAFPDVVTAIKAAGQTTDKAKRQQNYDTVNTLLKQYVPMIPVAHGASAVAFTAAVKNATSSPLGNEPFYIMDPGKDTLVWVQNGEPSALWCSDESDGESLRACLQSYDTLYKYKDGGVDTEPSLATSFDVNADATEYTFHLRENVKFSDGTVLNANDVVASWAMLWDASNPNHKGRTGTFDYFSGFFGAFLNAKK